MGSSPRERAVYRDLSFTNTSSIVHISRAGDALTAHDIISERQCLPHQIECTARHSGPLDPTYRYIYRYVCVDIYIDIKPAKMVEK